MTMKQYSKMSKPALIRKITKALRAMPKVKLARLCYNITKSKLPRLRSRVPKHRQWTFEEEAKQLLPLGIKVKERKKKRRASPKQIAWRKEFAKRA